MGGGGGASLVTQYWGGTRHFFLLILYNFKNIGWHVPPPPPPLPNPRSLVYQTDTLLAFHAFELSPYFCSHFQFLALLSKEQRIFFHPETVSIHENECLSPRKKETRYKERQSEKLWKQFMHGINAKKKIPINIERNSCKPDGVGNKIV